jgi:hypothetical protein
MISNEEGIGGYKLQKLFKAISFEGTMFKWLSNTAFRGIIK